MQGAKVRSIRTSINACQRGGSNYMSLQPQPCTRISTAQCSNQCNLLTLTFAPCVLTIASCACGVSLLSTGANIPRAQVAVVTSCNLCRWCFSIQPLLQIVHLDTWCYHSLQRALVVLFHLATGKNSVLAITQLALFGGCLWWWCCVNVNVWCCINVNVTVVVAYSYDGASMTKTDTLTE